MYKDELTDGVTDTYRELVSDIMEVIEKSKIFYDEPCVLWNEEYILSLCPDLRERVNGHRLSKRLDRCYGKLEKCV